MCQKKFSAILIIVFIILSFTGCNYPQNEIEVRIGYLNIVASLPLFIAEEKGYFDEVNIKYKTVQLTTSNQLVDGVAAGNLDYVVECSAVPVLAVELQSPGRMYIFAVSDITPEQPFDAIIVKEDAPIESLADLEGKKIGVFPGSTATNLLKKRLNDKGVNINNIKFSPIPPPNQLPALEANSVDAIHSYEPTVTIALTKGGYRKIHGSVYGEMIAPNPQGVSVVSSKFAKENSAINAKVIKAIEKAIAFMRSNESETREILKKRLKLSDQVAQKCDLLYMVPHKKVNLDVLQNYSDMMTDLGELQGKVDVKGIVYKGN